MSKTNEIILETRINQLINEIDKQDHFIELLRDQVAELKMTIQNKDRQIKDLRQTEFLATSRVVELEEKLTRLSAVEQQEKEITKVRAFLSIAENTSQYWKQCYYKRGDIIEEFSDWNIAYIEIIKCLLVFIQYLQWCTSRHVECLENLIDCDTRSISRLRNIIYDKDQTINKLQHLLNRETLRREDLQTANFNFIAKEKILKRKLELADNIIAEVNERTDHASFTSVCMDWLANYSLFDKQPENQIDTILDTFPTPSSLIDIQNQLAEKDKIIANLRSQQNGLFAYRDQLENQIEVLKKERKHELNYKKPFQEARQENKRLKFRLAQAEEKTEHLSKSMDEMRKGFKKQIVDLQANNKELKQNLYFSRDENQRLSNKCNSLITEKSRLKAKLTIADSIVATCNFILPSDGKIQVPGTFTASLQQYLNFDKEK